MAHLTRDPGNTLGRELSHKYRNEDPPPESSDVVRLIVRVVPEKVTGGSA